MNLTEIASLAGVSQSTASKAMRNSKEISPETCERIQKIAREAGYTRAESRKPRRRSVIAGPKIGVIYNDPVSPIYSSLVQNYGRKVRELGGVVLACDAEFNKHRLFDLIRYLDEECQVDGIVSTYMPFLLTQIPKTRAPMVAVISQKDHETMDRSAFDFDYIHVDRSFAIRDAIECLVRSGHKKIGCLSEQMAPGFADVIVLQMQNAGIRPETELFRVSEERFVEAGYREMKKLLDEGRCPTALLCAYDDIGIGAAMALAEAGLRVPEDVSVIGTGNSGLYTGDHKMLASIDQFVGQQADYVLDILMDRIRGNDGRTPVDICLRAIFVENDTVAPAKPYTLPRK